MPAKKAAKQRPPTPINDRQRRFCELVVAGMPAGRAYENAGYAVRGDVADAAAARMLGNDKVEAYLEELRAAAREKSKITLEEVVDFLAEAIRTPICDVDDASRLAQEKTVRTMGGADGPEIIDTKIKMVGKMDAVRQLAVMMGWNKPQKVEVDATREFADMMRRIRSRG